MPERTWDTASTEKALRGSALTIRADGKVEVDGKVVGMAGNLRSAENFEMGPRHTEHRLTLDLFYFDYEDD